MIRISFLLLLMFSASPAWSQKDPEARKILDKLSEISQADYPILAEFEYVWDDLMNKQSSTHKGSLIIKDDKFRLSIGESVVYCDGKTVWNHLTEVNEVYISDADDGTGTEEFFISNPSDLFNFYKEGFKYRLSGEMEYMGRIYYEIDIFPEDLDKNYHTVKLLINKKDNSLFSAEAYGKGGENHTVFLRDYKRRIKTDSKTFVFDPNEHPGIEVVDTRF